MIPLWPSQGPGGQPVFSPAPSPWGQAPSFPPPGCSAPLPPSSASVLTALPPSALTPYPHCPQSSSSSAFTCPESPVPLSLSGPPSCHPAPHQFLRDLGLPSTEWHLEWTSPQLAWEVPMFTSRRLPPLGQLSSLRHAPSAAFSGSPTFHCLFTLLLSPRHPTLMCTQTPCSENVSRPQGRPAPLSPAPHLLEPPLCTAFPGASPTGSSGPGVFSVPGGT